MKVFRKARHLYVAFMNLKKAYHNTDRSVILQVLQVFQVDEIPQRGVKSFYKESKECVGIDIKIRRILPSEG